MTTVGEGDSLGSKFTTLDYAFFVTMLLVSVGIGVYNGVRNRGRENTRTYLLGDRAMSPFPVAISLTGGIVSAVAVFGSSAEVYMYGTQASVTLLGFITCWIMVCYLIIPIFYTLELVSISEYLLLRYKSSIVHKLGTLCQLLEQFICLGMYLYTPSLAMATFTNISSQTSTITLGIVCTFYVAVGGVKAVVYTDVLQTLVMYAGVMVVVILCCVDLGGVASIWTIADQGSRIQFFNFDPSPFTRSTFWTTFVLGVSFCLRAIGVNQTTYQRIASVNSLTKAQWMCLSPFVGILVMYGLGYFSGLVVYAAYHQCDPLTSARIQKPDQIIPYLVMDKLGHLTGLPGVFVASVYGGVLSSLSSISNSIACLVWEDLLKDLPYFRKMSDVAATNVLRVLSTGAGLSAIGMAFLFENFGDLFTGSIIALGAVKGPLIGIYLAGICTPWVNAKGVVVGFLSGLSYSLWFVVGKLLRGGTSHFRLPLSTDGCPEALQYLANITSITSDNILNNITSTTSDNILVNSTLGTADIYFHDSDSIDASMTPVPVGNTIKGRTVYDISEFYVGMSGILITLIFSSLISFCTGPLRPGALESRLSSRSCTRLYGWVWRLIHGHVTKRNTEVMAQNNGGENELKFLAPSEARNEWNEDNVNKC